MLEQFYLDSIDQIKAIAEPTRWRMLHLLINQSMTGSQLARLLKIPRPLAHYHLKVLEHTGLVIFEQERTRNNMIEKYYCAIAKQYLTDNLLARGRQLPGQDEVAQQTIEAYSEVTRAMLELINADVIQPDAFPELLQVGFNDQEDVYLSMDEVTGFKQRMRALIAELRNLDEANRVTGGKKDLLHLRYTVFLTPAAAFDFDLAMKPHGNLHKRIETGLDS